MAIDLFAAFLRACGELGLQSVLLEPGSTLLTPRN